MQLPKTKEIKRTIPCLKCAAHTDQLLEPCEKGAQWKCTSCSNTSFAYSHEDMAKIVKSKIFGIREDPTIPTIPTGFRVYLEHATQGESEVPGEAVLEHCKCTGALPEVGKPMYVSKGGYPVPYGKVKRIEKTGIL